MKTKFFLFLLLVAATQMKANNMLVKNVTTTGNNATNKTIQVQFDMSWDNSWRDGINWDAAWVFMKYKDASGNWQHVMLNTTGFANGTGTANTIQVGSDKVGAFVYRSAAGTGTFASTTMQLQWNYGLSGLTNVTGLEVRVFAVEMVYVPQGDFTIRNDITMSFFNHCYEPNTGQLDYFCSGYSSSIMNFRPLGTNGPTAVINSRLSPVIISYEPQNDWSFFSIKIKGNSGIDYNNDGVVENTNYPTGFSPFYCYKYEMSEQQYADFLNTLTASQIAGVGGAGSNIFNSNQQYYSSTPNNACRNGNAFRMLAYADWSGLRPMTFLEFYKACNGPLMSNNLNNQSGGSYYGIKDLIGNLFEPCVRLLYNSFTNTNGNGIIGTNGDSNVNFWNYDETSASAMIGFVSMGWDDGDYFNYPTGHGFRYVRSAE